MQLKTHEYPPKIFFKDLEQTFRYRVDILRGKVSKGIIDTKTIVQAEKEVIDSIVDKQWQESAQSYICYKRNDIKSLEPKTSGVYLIYDKKDVLRYIGKSGDLKSRLYSHFTRFEVGCMIVYEIDYPMIALVEMHLISHLFPYDNSEGKLLYDGIGINDPYENCKTLFLKNQSIVLSPIKFTYV
jgi:hypothetical protein